MEKVKAKGKVKAPAKPRARKPSRPAGIALSIACAEGDQMGAMPAGLEGFFALGFAFAFTFTFAVALVLAFSMTTLSPTPDTREPGLLFAGQARRAVVVLEFREAGPREEAAP